MLLVFVKSDIQPPNRLLLNCLLKTNRWYRATMCKTRPAGQVRPATRFCPAREMFLNNLEEGLPTSFDTSKRNIVVLDDLMAETDERVTNLFTKKSHHCNTSVIYLVQNLFPKKQGVVAPSVWTHST